MDKALFDRIVQQLLPAMGNTSSRQALVQSALFGSPILHQINWSGAARPFTVQLVTQLFQYDVSALVAVLEELKTQVGHTRRAQIDALIQDLTLQCQLVKNEVN